MKVIRENGVIVAYRHWGRWWWKPYILCEFEAAPSVGERKEG